MPSSIVPPYFDCVIMRGGTSRGPVMLSSALPPAGVALDTFAVKLVGGELSQVDGVGGGNPQTSKMVLLRKAEINDQDIDIDYAVGNIVMGHGTVDWSGTCGNMTATVPVFALEEGLIPSSRQGEMRLRNLSTNGLIDACVRNAGSHRRGDQATVHTAYLHPVGSVFSTLLPTGSAIDTLRVDDRDFEATIIDITHPYLFLKYEDIAGGTAIDAEAVALIERIRAVACWRLGVVQNPSDAMRLSPAIPRVVLIHQFSPCITNEIMVTAVSMGQIISSVPVTSAMCLAGASSVPGTLPARVVGTRNRKGPLRVFSSGGEMIASVETDGDNKIISTGVDRTVRSIMSGKAYVAGM